MFDNIVTEMRSKPFTMILLLGLWGAVGMLWTSKNSYASATDLEQVKSQIAAVDTSVKRGNLESQLRNITTELFNLQRIVDDMKAKGKNPDQIYFDRLNSLQSDREQLNRQLAALK